MHSFPPTRAKKTLEQEVTGRLELQPLLDLLANKRVELGGALDRGREPGTEGEKLDRGGEVFWL